MIAWTPIVRRAYRYMTSWTAGSYQSIDVTPVQTHDVEIIHDKPSRTLKHLLKANHVNYAILYHNLEFNNHLPHILCSAYLLGANEDQLHHIYNNEIKELEEWTDSPGEIDLHDWRLFLGDKRYQRAYVDFFEDELALKHDYDWKTVAREFLFEGSNPLINSVISGLGHPLIHLGYAFEFNNREIAMEALGEIASEYDFLHKYSDDPSYTKPSPYTSTSPLEILQKISSDPRLDDTRKGGQDELGRLFQTHEDIVLEYWNSWTITDPLKQFQNSQEAAVAVLTATVAQGAANYNFFLCHVLTTSHAVRILLPSIPAKFHVPVVRQWWLLTIGVYITQLRPKIDNSPIETTALSDKDWKHISHLAITGPHRTDSHYVKAIRAMKEAASTWGDVDKKYLRAAVRFSEEFDGWSF